MTENKYITIPIDLLVCSRACFTPLDADGTWIFVKAKI